MKWSRPGERQTCYAFDFEEKTSAALAVEFMEFWKTFADTVLPANREIGVEWNFLRIRIKGPSGVIEVWPKHINHMEMPAIDRPLVYWASIYIVRLEDFYFDELGEDEFGSPKDLAEKRRWMKMVVDGAEAVHFAELAGFGEKGLPVRFHVYDDEIPIWETTIGGPATAE